MPSVGSFLDPFDIFGSITGNPSDDSMKYLSQIKDQVGNYYNPYIQAGQRQLPGLEQYYSMAMNDPNAIMNKIGSGYQQSPGFQFALQQALGGANRSSAAGGMAGSPLAQQNNMSVATGLANQDYGNYMNRALGLQGRGVEGAQGLYNTGFKASSSMADAIQQMLSQQAAMKYAGNASRNAGIGSLFGDAASFLPFLMG